MKQPNYTAAAAISIARLVSTIAALRMGQALHLQYRSGRRLWNLSDGTAVPADVAEVLTKHASIVPVGDALFDGLPGQTWRYAG
jgi:hypothetical protein